MGQTTWRDKVREEYDYEYQLASEAYKGLEQEKLWILYKKMVVELSKQAEQAKVVFHGFPTGALSYKNNLEPEEMLREDESNILDVLHNDKTIGESIERFESILESSEEEFTTKLDTPEHHEKSKDLIRRIYEVSGSSKKVNFIENLVFSFSKEELPQLTETLEDMDRGEFNRIHLIEFSAERMYYRTNPWEIIATRSVFLKSGHQDLTDRINKDLEGFDGELVEEKVLF